VDDKDISLQLFALIVGLNAYNVLELIRFAAYLKSLCFVERALKEQKLC
jgi:hypothetical protein